MKQKYFKILFSILSPVLVFYFAFFPILVSAQGFFDLPPGSGESGFLDPESENYLKQTDVAKQNEKAVEPKSLAELEKTTACDKIKWWDAAGSFGCVIFRILNAVVDFVIVFPLGLSTGFLETIAEININGAAYSSEFVTRGWGITRDVANMFFIFIVLWMALATIFQFENYSAKRLLPKLIIVALLVNFSLPIGRFVISVSNAIAVVFYNTAKGDDNLSTRITNMINVDATIQTVELTPENQVVNGLSECKEFQQAQEEVARVGWWRELWGRLGGSTGSAKLDSAIEACTRAYQLTKLEQEKGGGILTLAFVALFWKLVIGLISSFVFFAGGIFLLVRYISLVTLLIFGPIAFLFMILPATQEHWNDWWRKLTQWSFFAPVFFFMIMLSVLLSKTLLPAEVLRGSKGSASSLFFNYFLTSGLFIASLMVAQKMGIAMSGTVVGWGRGATGYLKKHAKAASFRGAARMGGRFAEGALKSPAAQYMASLPGARALLRPIELAAGAKRGVEEDRAKLLSRAMATAPAEYAAARFRGERATVQANYLRSAGEKDIQKLEKGMPEEAMGTIIGQLKTIAPELGKKIGGSFKNVDLRVAATKGVTMGTPEFERARQEYMGERTPHELGQILTPENLQKEWVQKYLLQEGGEKEMDAITKTGEQFKALSSMFEEWADAEISGSTTLGNEIQQLITIGQQSYGYSAEQAKREAITSHLPELLEAKGQQMRVTTSPAMKSWAQTTPTRIMFSEGRLLRKGTDMDELLRRLTGNAPPSQPPGGSVNP